MLTFKLLNQLTERRKNPKFDLFFLKSHSLMFSASLLLFSLFQGKLAGKTSKQKYQWKIMREMNVPEEEIVRFCDANYWLQYFPPIARVP